MSNRLFLRYPLAVVATAVALLCRQAMVGYLGDELPHYITFYPAVMLVAILAGAGPALLATAVAAVLAAYWVLPPQGHFGITKTVDVVGLIFFSVMGVLISLVAELYRRARQKAAAYDHEVTLRKSQEALRKYDERMRVAAMAAEVGVWNWNRHTGEVVVDANWKCLFGIAEDSVVSFDTWRNALHPDDRDRTVKALMSGSEQRQLWDEHPGYRAEYRVVWPDGTVRWLVDRGRASYDENGQAIGMAGVNLDITDRKRAEKRLAHLASFPELSPDIVFETDLAGNITYTNPAALRLFPDFAQAGEKHPLLRDWSAVVAFLTGGQVSMERDLEVGALVFHQVITHLPELEVVRTYTMDITQRKRAEATVRASLAEKTALLQEVHHRVKNNLQIVFSLLSIQARQLKSPAVLETLRETQNRIRSMALLHETLYREGNASRVNCAVYFKHLCAHLCRTFGQMAERVRLETNVAPVELSLDLAIPCGLIVNELVSNAFKHAFPAERCGNITVALRVEDQGRTVLSVADDGIGFSAAIDHNNAHTLGMQLVTGLLKQISASMEVTASPGAMFRITFRTPGKATTS